jgi:hypothetical protein
MDEGAPRFRLTLTFKDPGGAFICCRLEEYREAGWVSCGVLTIESEGYEELKVAIILGFKKTGGVLETLSLL